MTDDEFETIWALQSRTRPHPGVPDLTVMAAYVAKHPEGVDAVKLCRRFENESHSRGDAQLGVQRVTDRLCRLRRDNTIVVREIAP